MSTFVINNKIKDVNQIEKNTSVVNKDQKKSRIIIGAQCFLSILFWCSLNALITMIMSMVILRSKIAKILEFSIPFSLMGCQFEFPLVYKKLIITLIILSIQTIVSKSAMDAFEFYKLEYKKSLYVDRQIKGPIEEKTKDAAKSDYWHAMLIVGVTVLIRNFSREFREIFQILFNNSKYSFLQYYVILFFIISIDLMTKYSKRYENKRCRELLNKEKSKIMSSEDKKIIDFISFAKRKIGSKFLQKHDFHVNELLIVVISSFCSIYLAKYMLNKKILLGLNLNFYVGDNLFTFISNKNFLITNIFSDFFFASIVTAFLFSIPQNNKDNDQSDSLQVLNKNRVRKFFICFANAILFSVGLGSSIQITNSLNNLENFGNIGDKFKIELSLIFAYFLIVCSYTILNSYFEISDAKKVFLDQDLKENKEVNVGFSSTEEVLFSQQELKAT